MVESLLTETSGLAPLPCGKTKKTEPDWWYRPVILILGRQRQDCYTSKPSLVYRVSFRLATAGEAMSKAPKVRW